MNEATYRYGNDLDLDQVIELYHAATLGERRPVDDRQIMADMIRHANLVVTAWDGALLVGMARTLTDFSYVGYLADLAVRQAFQRQGIGGDRYIFLRMIFMFFLLPLRPLRLCGRYSEFR